MPEHSVLLIDDDPDVLRTIGKYFERLDYTVYQAGSGKEGMGTWQRFKPDVTVLDLLLPDMSGMEVLETLRRERATVIMLTGHADVDLAVRAVEKNALRKENAELRIRLKPNLTRRVLRISIPAALIAAAAAVGMLIGGGSGDDVRPRRPIPVPLDTGQAVVTTPIPQDIPFPELRRSLRSPRRSSSPRPRRCVTLAFCRPFSRCSSERRAYG